MNTNRSLVILLIALGVISMLAFGAMMTGPGMGPGMMGGYYGNTQPAPGGWGFTMGFGMLLMLTFWVAVGVGIVLVVRALGGTAPTPNSPSTTEEPLAILQRRYAAGEIDEATYERMKEKLAA